MGKMKDLAYNFSLWDIANLLYKHGEIEAYEQMKAYIVNIVDVDAGLNDADNDDL